MKEIGKRGYQLSNFDVVSKIFHNYLKKLLKYPYILQILIFVRPYFIHILQLTWLIARDWTQKQLFNYWDLQKCRTTCHSTHYFYYWKIVEICKSVEQYATPFITFIFGKLINVCKIVLFIWKLYEFITVIFE